MQFKVGDKVVARGRDELNTYTGTVSRISSPGIEVDKDNGSRAWSCSIKGEKVATACGCWDGVSYLELIESVKTKTIMEKVSVMMKKLLSKDIQTLVKAGYINGDLDLTEQGQKVLMAQLFDANKAELVKSAEEDIAEAEKKA